MIFSFASKGVWQGCKVLWHGIGGAVGGGLGTWGRFVTRINVLVDFENGVKRDIILLPLPKKGLNLVRETRTEDSNIHVSRIH